MVIVGDINNFLGKEEIVPWIDVPRPPTSKARSTSFLGDFLQLKEKEVTIPNKLKKWFLEDFTKKGEEFNIDPEAKRVQKIAQYVDATRIPRNLLRPIDVPHMKNLFDPTPPKEFLKETDYSGFPIDDPTKMQPRDVLGVMAAATSAPKIFKATAKYWKDQFNVLSSISEIFGPGLTTMFKTVVWPMLKGMGKALISLAKAFAKSALYTIKGTIKYYKEIMGTLVKTAAIIARKFLKFVFGGPLTSIAKSAWKAIHVMFLGQLQSIIMIFVRLMIVALLVKFLEKLGLLGVHAFRDLLDKDGYDLVHSKNLTPDTLFQTDLAKDKWKCHSLTEEISDKAMEKHPTITFAQPQTIVHVNLREIGSTNGPNKCHPYWDAIYNLRGHNVLTEDAKPLGGRWPYYFRMCPQGNRIGAPSKLTHMWCQVTKMGPRKFIFTADAGDETMMIGKQILDVNFTPGKSAAAQSAHILAGDAMQLAHL